MTPVLVVSSGVAISWETILTPLCRVCQSAQCRVIRTAMAGIAAHSHRSARAMHFSVVISLNLCIHCCQIWHMGNSEKNTFCKFSTILAISEYFHNTSNLRMFPRYSQSQNISTISAISECFHNISNLRMFP